MKKQEVEIEVDIKDYKSAVVSPLRFIMWRVSGRL